MQSTCYQCTTTCSAPACVLLLGENYLTEGYVVTPKTMDILKQHLKDTGGMVGGGGWQSVGCGWVGEWVWVGGYKWLWVGVLEDHLLVRCEGCAA